MAANRATRIVASSRLRCTGDSFHQRWVVKGRMQQASKLVGGPDGPEGDSGALAKTEAVDATTGSDDQEPIDNSQADNRSICLGE